jgi:hypothetical protein
MLRSTQARRASLVAVTALLAFPATGLAASSAATDAGTTVGSELSVVAPATTNLTPLTHAAAATGSEDVTVTSTAQNWSLEATDGATTGAGHLTNGSTSLIAPLQVTSGGSSGDLTSTGVAVAGSMVETKTFVFTQALGATEDVLVGDGYRLTVTYTVSGS